MGEMLFRRQAESELPEALVSSDAGAPWLVAERRDAPWPPHGPRGGGSARPRVRGKYLEVNGRTFWVRGVTYGTFAPNDAGEPYPPFDRLREDFAHMARAGINTVRLYTPPSDRIADAAAEAGLYLIPDVCWGPRWCELHRRQDLKQIFDWTRGHARRLAGHPAMLMHSIGNEIPPLLVRWYGRRYVERFLADLCDTVKAESPDALVTYACHPPTEHLHLPFLDVVSFNVYLERERDFRRYLARLQNLAGNRPLLLSEIGLDAAAHGEAAQARVLDWQVRAAMEKGLCGAVLYSWTDEWSIFNEQVEGWAFGLTNAAREPRLALETVSRLYGSTHAELRQTPWPRVSVVVCAYNGAATLEGCLRSLARLRYPNYEVIVIDDGSKDQTSAIAGRFPVRCLRVDNGGLSRARNLGISESSGEVIAFIDCDAYADPDWLFHIVYALEEQGAAAAGGPNVSPPGDGFVAQCVDHAPGNPTHVLIDDERAEHVPGCNMAFRREALAEIGNFDAVHRAAGDDVDVCWKLLAREKRIGFAPGALVWHHRRPTVRAFLRQQRGYGFAEAHLRRRHPGHFNVFGHGVWSGGIYDGMHEGMRAVGIPRLFRPRVYQGRFCGAPFQSLYQPFATWWFQVFTTVEWQSLALCVLAAGLLSLVTHVALGIALTVVAAALVGLTIAAAGTAGWHAARVKRWRGVRAWRGALTVALLHVLQPWARAAGRVGGILAASNPRHEWPAEQVVWGNLTQREQWLHRLSEHLKRCGWHCRDAGDWSDADLEITGPGPCRVELRSVAEERLEKGWYFVRFRLRSRMKLAAIVGAALLLAFLACLCRVPTLLPLAVPMVVVLWTIARAPSRMTAAVSQLAMECAEAIDMPKVEGVTL